MRTLIFILVGLLLVVLAATLTKPGQRKTAVGVFSVGWLMAVLWNLRTGMSHGYSFAEEVPIQLLIFAVPVIVGWWLAIKARSRRDAQ